MSSKLVQTITSLNSSLDSSTVQQLAECFETYNIAWVEVEGEPLFYCQNLSIAKGLASDDFIKNYVIECVKQEQLEPILQKRVSSLQSEWVNKQGVRQVINVTGQPLKQLKQLFGLDIVGKRAAAGLFCYWETAFHYLSQGHSTTARDVSSIGAQAVVKQAKQEVAAATLNSKATTQLHNEACSTYIKPCTEQLLQDVIIQLASYGLQHFTQEFCFAPDGKRADLVNIQGNKVSVYELKATQLTGQHVTDKLQYIELMQQRYPNKEVKLILVSPLGCAVDAELAILKAKSAATPVAYLPYAYLIKQIVKNVLTYQAQEGHWFIKQCLINTLKQLPETVLPIAQVTPNLLN